MKNILLTIAYDGSRFHGWQRQPEDVTVQGYLEQTFSRLFDRQILLNGTSRTDAGVHALGQRASFKADISIPTERLARVMNNALCGREDGAFALAPVRILEAKEMPEDFHARFDSRGKKYIYRISTSEQPDVFRRNYVYFPMQRGLQGPWDIEAMRQAARERPPCGPFSKRRSGGRVRSDRMQRLKRLRTACPGRGTRRRGWERGRMRSSLKSAATDSCIIWYGS